MQELDLFLWRCSAKIPVIAKPPCSADRQRHGRDKGRTASGDDACTGRGNGITARSAGNFGRLWRTTLFGDQYAGWLADGVGFEPTVRFPPRRFSRPLP